MHIAFLGIDSYYFRRGRVAVQTNVLLIVGRGCLPTSSLRSVS